MLKKQSVRLRRKYKGERYDKKTTMAEEQKKTIEIAIRSEEHAKVLTQFIRRLTYGEILNKADASDGEEYCISQTRKILESLGDLENSLNNMGIVPGKNCKGAESNITDENRVDEDDPKKYEQWDFVDNTIHEMIIKLNPSTQTLDWDIKPISEIREVLIQYFVKDLQICTEDEFYP